MCALPTAMITLMDVFDSYASSDGESEYLSKAEVKNLLQKEMPELLQVPCTCGEG